MEANSSSKQEKAGLRACFSSLLTLEPCPCPWPPLGLSSPFPKIKSLDQMIAEVSFSPPSHKTLQVLSELLLHPPTPDSNNPFQQQEKKTSKQEKPNQTNKQQKNRKDACPVLSLGGTGIWEVQPGGQ